ncbi:MAG TPA: 2-hydroxyacid dehydrogenase [Chloroflexota bacterium]|nr:2-hydroxyacid dehydrogenase [Chloroflexota bacterium]
MTQRILYRLQPWEFVDRLVYESCPAEFEIVPLARDASAEDRHAKLAEADFIMGSWVTTAVTLNEDDFRAARKLKLVQVMSAGYEHLDLDLAARYGVPVAHFGDAMASTVAEHTLMLILALLRRLPQLDAAVRAGKWRTGEPPMYELRGKRVGIVGLGLIGREVARRLQAFDAELVYHQRHSLDVDLPYLPLDELLSTSDVVTLNVPISASTHHLIGARELGLMKPGALLINVSRGPVVDEAALLAALQAGRLAGAALDVLEQEPPDTANPLLALDNVILTPHDAGSSAEVWPRVIANCFANIQRVARGEPPQNLAVKY